MVPTLLSTWLVHALLASSLASETQALADSTAAGADSASSPHRVVRRFPPLEVRAPFVDLESSQSVHVMSRAALRALPVDDLAGVLALQTGVVAESEELHVRGGRAGETTVFLDGLRLNEPLRGRWVEPPLFALRSAELVTGAAEAQYAAGLAGALALTTVDPTPRPSLEWRWRTDGGLDTRHDRASVRASAPLGFGLGLVTAADALLDDTWLPALRTRSRHEVAGLSVGWRAENRLLAFLKLAPVERPRRFGVQVFASRQVHQPFDPAWSLDGWTFVPASPKASPVFSPDPLPGYQRYRAADHLPITEEGQVAALITASTGGASRHATLGLGWLRSRSVSSVGGGHEDPGVVHRPRYMNPGVLQYDPFHVVWGDYSLYRESGSDVLTLQLDAEAEQRSGSRVKAGAGLTYEDVWLHEVDWMPLGWDPGGDAIVVPLDSIRSYHAYAPGSFAYAQGRWLSGGLIVNAGLRAEYHTPGRAGERQTLPGDARGTLSWSPTLGLAYPISVRDVFSIGYVRVHQSPARDYLYDRRTAITNRQPLGNPGLAPATLISYEAAVKHLFGPTWALQASVFYRDVYGQVGARYGTIPRGPANVLYTNQDEAQAIGFEWTWTHEADDRRFEARYTWAQAWGSESRSEGDPYGVVREADIPPLADTPLSWDRRHSLVANGVWPLGRQTSVAWSTSLASPLPWTPKPRRATQTDLSAVNSRRLDWIEATNLDLRWAPRPLRGLTLGLEVRNLFDHRGELAATVDGYPNPVVNTIYDDYGAYRTETGLSGGGYWVTVGTGSYWVPVNDPRLFQPPRSVRASVGASW